MTNWTGEKITHEFEAGNVEYVVVEDLGESVRLEIIHLKTNYSMPPWGISPLVEKHRVSVPVGYQWKNI